MIVLSATMTRSLLPVMALLLIAGCATQPPVIDSDADANWVTRRSELAKIRHWQLEGRISIVVDNDAWSASLQWDQQDVAYVLRVIAPLAQGTVELQGTGEGKVSLRVDNEREVHADNPEDLLQETLGWSVPVTGMAWWIRGLPDPGIRLDDLQLDEAGRVLEMRQEGWHIIYTRYHQLKELELPGRIRMVNGNLRLRIAIRDWQLPVAGS